MPSYRQSNPQAIDLNLSPEQLSLAWQHLVEVEWQLEMYPHLQPPSIPEPLKNLSELEWMLVSNLLESELERKSRSQVH
jgi:hypothetical protein